MKKIETIEYKEFTTDFFLTPGLDDELEKRGVFQRDITQKNLLKDNDNYNMFYELFLFELIEDKDFGNKFEIIYFKIVDGRELGEDELKEIGFESEFDYDISNKIGLFETTLNLSEGNKIIIGGIVLRK